MNGCPKYQRLQAEYQERLRCCNLLAARIKKVQIEDHIKHCSTCLMKDSIDYREFEREPIFRN